MREVAVNFSNNYYYLCFWLVFYFLSYVLSSFSLFALAKNNLGVQKDTKVYRRSQ